MASVLVLSFSDLAGDPRVSRQLQWLAGHEVIAAGYGPPASGTVRYIDIAPAADRRHAGTRALALTTLLTRRFESRYWSHDATRAAEGALAGVAVDLVIANDVETLPLALALPGNPPVLFDAHEYKPREFEDRWRFRLFAAYFRYLWQTYVPRARVTTVVSPGIAEACLRDTGVKPHVLTNATAYLPLAPVPPMEGRVRLVTHGYAISSRHIERTLDLMQYLDGRFTLDLFLKPSTPGYLEKLRARGAGDPRVAFRPPVPLADLVAATNPFDIGVFLLPPVNLNYRHALPNKFFEFVQARLGVAIGPSPDMATIAREGGFGIVSRDFEAKSLAAELSGLTTSDITQLKAAAHRAAEPLSAERNADLFRELVAVALRS